MNDLKSTVLLDSEPMQGRIPTMSCEISFRMESKDWDLVKFMTLMEKTIKEMGPSAAVSRFNMWS